MISLFKRHILIPLLMLILLAIPPLLAVARDGQPQQPTVIVLSASWCATCREITPMVRRLANERQGLEMVVLDVDEPASRSQAASYGINIEGSAVPQVYLFNGGRTVLIFNGKNYKFGQSREAESQIRRGLSAL